MMDFNGVVIGSVDNVVPGIGLLVMFICGTVIALKYAFISRFDSFFMNSLDRSFQSIMRKLVLFIVLTGILSLESYALLSSKEDKIPIAIVADVFIGIVCFYRWIEYKRNQETKKENTLLIKLYILYGGCVLFQALAADLLKPNKTVAIVIGIVFSIFSSLYTILLYYDYEYKFFRNSQYYFIREGITYYLHYIVKDNLMLCSSTGDLEGNTDRYLIDLSEIECIKKVDGNKMIISTDDKNKNEVSSDITKYKTKTPEEMYDEMIALIKKGKKKKVSKLVDECVAVLDGVGQSRLNNIQTIADLHYDKNGVSIMLSLIAVLVAIYTLYGTFGKNLSENIAFVFILLPSLEAIIMLIWTILESRKRKPYIIISSAIEECRHKL